MLIGKGETRMTPEIQAPAPVWLTVRQAAKRAQCGPKVIYRAVNDGRLRAVAIGGRRELRFRAEWIDGWLETCSTQAEIQLHR